MYQLCLDIVALIYLNIADIAALNLNIAAMLYLDIAETESPLGGLASVGITICDTN